MPPTPVDYLRLWESSRVDTRSIVADIITSFGQWMSVPTNSQPTRVYICSLLEGIPISVCSPSALPRPLRRSRPDSLPASPETSYTNAEGSIFLKKPLPSQQRLANLKHPITKLAFVRQLSEKWDTSVRLSRGSMYRSPAGFVCKMLYD